MFDNDFEVDNEATVWGSIEWALSDNWAVEGFYAEDETTYKDLGADADVRTWSVDLLHYWGSYIGEGGRIRPYLGFGMGELEFEADTFDDVQTAANVAAGMRWMLTQRLGVRAEARAIHTLDEDKTNMLFSLGLNYYFGKVAEDVQVAAVAEPVDSDGDGVTDDKDQCPGTPAGVRVDAMGCPLPVAKVASIKLKVNFPFDSAVVGERYFSDIAELAAFLKRFDDLQVDVEGHTDSTGPEDYNQQLSQRRAQAVVDALVNQHGIAASRLEAVGYGESRPVASNDSKEGRAENRRVMATLEVEYEE
jgi:OOP family OmpA-OmpF porin